MWGRFSTCGGFVTRLGGSGTLVGRPVENRPQVKNLPHNLKLLGTVSGPGTDSSGCPPRQIVAETAVEFGVRDGIVEAGEGSFRGNRSRRMPSSAKSATSSPMSSRVRTPGAKRTSAPASAYARRRRSASRNGPGWPAGKHSARLVCEAGFEIGVDGQIHRGHDFRDMRERLRA